MRQSAADSEFAGYEFSRRMFHPDGRGSIFTRLFRPSGEVLSLASPRESTQREGRPGALIGCAGALRSSPLRGAHNSAGKPASNRVRALFPEWLRYSVQCKRVTVNRATVNGWRSELTGFTPVWRSQSIAGNPRTGQQLRDRPSGRNRQLKKDPARSSETMSRIKGNTLRCRVDLNR